MLDNFWYFHVFPLFAARHKRISTRAILTQVSLFIILYRKRVRHTMMNNQFWQHFTNLGNFRNIMLTFRASAWVSHWPSMSLCSSSATITIYDLTKHSQSNFRKMSPSSDSPCSPLIYNAPLLLCIYERPAVLLCNTSRYTTLHDFTARSWRRI